MSLEDHGYIFLALFILAVLFGSAEGRGFQRLSLAVLFAIGGQLYYIMVNHV